MINILLLFPPSTVHGDDPTVPSAAPPLGLAYIAGYLERHGYQVDILDARSLSQDRVIRRGDTALYGLTDSEIRAQVEKNNPDIVGISCMYTAYSSDAHRVAGIVKGINKTIPVLMGGAHASTFSRLVLKDTNVDVVVHAEGEETFLELAGCIDGKKNYTGIKGISLRNNGAVITNPPRPFIKDLDTVPFPARHLLDMNLYLNKAPNPYAMRAPSTTMITSRGCPQACIYCTIQSVWGVRRWRGRSPGNVVDEMESLQKTYGIQELYWMDDSAGTSKKRLLEICDEIIKRRLDIKWTTPNGIAHWYLDEHVLARMKAAGCYRVTFGIESGNAGTRKFLGKPFSLEQAERMIRYANKIGMWTVCTYILGFPYEQLDSIKDTVKFAIRSDTDFAVFYLLCPHPGTRVYEIFKKEGLLNLDELLDPLGPVTSEDYAGIGRVLAGRGVQTKCFSPQELGGLLSKAYKSFFKARAGSFLNPVRILKKTHSFEDFIYVLRLGSTAAKSLLRLLKSGQFSSQMLYRDAKKD